MIFFRKTIREMAKVASAIGAGDRRKRVMVPARGAAADLARAINAMAEQLERESLARDVDREKLAAILSSMTEGVVAVDSQEAVLHINLSAQHLLEIQGLPPVGKKIWEATRAREVTGILEETLKSGLVQTREVKLSVGGKERALQFRCESLKDESGGVLGAVLVIHDVTELRNLENIRRDFVANVSHELKTPITAIKGLAETILSDQQMEEKTRTRFLQKIANQSERLLTLVQDLLALAKLESKKEGLEKQRFDLSAMVQGAVHSFEGVFRSRRFDCKMEIAPDIFMVGDEEALLVSLNNLLDNACKYTPEGGQVAIRLYQEKKQAVLEVQDSGVGIPAEQQKRIFERFYRVDAARSREQGDSAPGGSGLGLSIVKNVILSHGGTVEVKSQPGEGSLFKIVLPF